MLRFKVKAVEQRLEERKSELTLPTHQYIRRTVDQGAEGMGHQTLSNLCRDLKCLPTDIVEFV
jgi:DNA-binding Xre family transcriptional regulator